MLHLTSAALWLCKNLVTSSELFVSSRRGLLGLTLQRPGVNGTHPCPVCPCLSCSYRLSSLDSNLSMWWLLFKPLKVINCNSPVDTYLNILHTVCSEIQLVQFNSQTGGASDKMIWINLTILLFWEIAVSSLTVWQWRDRKVKTIPLLVFRLHFTLSNGQI